jgi:uncharacterized protein
MLWAVYCIDNADTEALRAEHLVVHRKYLDEWNTRIFFSGPLQSDDAKTSLGSLFILNVKDRAEAELYANSEPFNKNGVYKSVTIHRMRKGRYSPNLVDVP